MQIKVSSPFDGSRALCRDAYRPKENVSPGSKLPIFRLTRTAADSDEVPPPASSTESPQVELQGSHWGLVPAFTAAGSKPDFFRMFNARCETVMSKSVFSRLLKHRHQRCLVAVEGFYEWKAEHKVKQPYYLRLKDRPLIFAGLCDTWHKGTGDDADLPSCTILTTEVSERLAWLHTRMPVVLPDAAACAQWLTGDVHRAQSLCAPYNGADLVWHVVTPYMNKASYQEADCSKPLKRTQMSSFFSRTSRGAAAADQAGAAQTGHEETRNADETTAPVKVENSSQLGLEEITARKAGGAKETEIAIESKQERIEDAIRRHQKSDRERRIKTQGAAPAKAAKSRSCQAITLRQMAQSHSIHSLQLRLMLDRLLEHAVLAAKGMPASGFPVFPTGSTVFTCVRRVQTDTCSRCTRVDMYQQHTDLL